MNHGINPHFSRRTPIMGARGAVATSQPLAAQAGLNALRAGGNAVDAAIAMAACLTVVEPTSNGIGGDAFALIWDGQKLHGLNASGRAPQGLTPQLLESKGHASMPQRGWLTVTVPGAPAAWRDAHAKFGRLPFERLFDDAIHYAEHGFAVSPMVSKFWGSAARAYSSLPGEEFKPWFETFTRGGDTPRVGQLMRLPDHGRTLRLIAQSQSEAFYQGELAQALEDFAARTGGVMTKADLEAHESTWVDPISTSYRGYDVWEIPPNGQGITALNALNILEGFDLGRMVAGSLERYHVSIEAIKLAFSDAHEHIGDPARADVPIRGLLDKEYAAQRRALISEMALEPTAGQPPRGGTVYLCAADADGMMISFIQSNYAGFGSGLVVPGTGIALQNRGANFTLQADHANRLEPGKRPYHTIIPGFLTRAGAAVGPFGVMGGFMQPQGHLQVVVSTVDDHLNPQAALDAPRWQWLEGKRIELEPSVPAHIAEGLRSKGHDVSLQLEPASFGRGQIIWREGETLIAASESRCDGQALAF